MANQDILFPLLPRNTRVDVSDRNLRVKRIQPSTRPARVEEEEVRLGSRTTTPVRDYLDEREQQHEQPAQQQPSSDGANHATHQLPEPAPVADDPRQKHLDQDDERHKGVHLDTFV